MSLAEVAPLLCCPVCRAMLTTASRALQCDNGHSFDLARQGYVNLLGTAAPANADTAAMLEARSRVHDRGVFDPVAAMVATLCEGRGRILEVGAGTGHYLAAALGDNAAATGIAMDVSKNAARICARRDPRVGAVVADVWQPLPIRDNSLDVVLAAFAPRNLPEFARVLHRDGRFIAVTPRPGHLVGLRDAYGLLDVPTEKAERLAAAATEFFDLIDTRVVKYRIDADEQLASDLIAMGPNAFHDLPEQVSASAVGIDVTVQSFRPLD